MNTHIVTANRGWKSVPMSRDHAQWFRYRLIALGNVNVHIRKVKP